MGQQQLEWSPWYSINRTIERRIAENRHGQKNARIYSEQRRRRAGGLCKTTAAKTDLSADVLHRYNTLINFSSMDEAYKDGRFYLRLFAILRTEYAHRKIIV